MDETVKFKLYGLTATVNFHFSIDDLGIDRNGDTDKRAVYTCTITGRHDSGQGRVFHAIGMSIQHPQDCYSEEIGKKLAFIDAAENFYKREGLDYLAWFTEGCSIEIDEYTAIWWSAYQRARHGREELPYTEDEYILQAFT